jgi:hypothetical protein
MSDALERLKKRQRPTVPTRDASLSLTSLPTPPVLDTSTTSSLEVAAAKAISPSSSPKPAVTLQTKQSTLRLEQGVSDRLQAIARRNGLCREVLIEAMFEYCEAHPEAMQAVLEESRSKNDYRQQIANLKRAKSMMQRFGNTDS